jgi:hypothetical protein
METDRKDRAEGSCQTANTRFGADMVWFYEKHGTYIRCETRVRAGGGYELVIVKPTAPSKSSGIATPRR